MSTNRRSSKVLALALGSLIGLSSSANADVGDLDPTFGIGGKLTTDVSGDRDEANALAIQPDGKIVAAGIANGDFALARYNAFGSLDLTFGNNGKVITDFAGGSDVASAVAILSNGKILVAGGAGGASSLDFALARYNTDGTLDTTFGIGGKVISDFGTNVRANVMAIQPDGKIVAVGTAGAESRRDFALAQYNADGSLDTAFGNDGKIISDFFGDGDRAFAVAIQSDGKIVVAGTAGNVPREDFALARYKTDGTLDVSFGIGGKVTTDLGGNEGVRSLATKSDRKIVARGFVTTAFCNDFAIAQYNMDGTLDTNFGAGGKIRTIFGSHNYGGPITTQPDGKIVVAGADDLGPTYDFVVGRFNADGTMDTSLVRRTSCFSSSTRDCGRGLEADRQYCRLLPLLRHSTAIRRLLYSCTQ